VGHYQPHLPADLGFYDLRVPEVRHQQIALAKTYGIDAFCYYFYWFSGKRLMERPLDDMLADPKTDLPFCVCWANENWTRRWDSLDHDVLIAQNYTPDHRVESIRAMEHYLRDERYLTLNGKKVIVVYRPQQLPDSMNWMKEWRDYARQSGLGELHLVCVLNGDNWEYEKYGFDSGVEFPPHNIAASYVGLQKELGFHKDFRGDCPDYHEFAEAYLSRDLNKKLDVFRTVAPSWDNTARRKEKAWVTLNATPANYEYWLHRAIETTKKEHPGSDRLVFVNAWNEWAEGCHLEPDQKHGLGFLEATLRAKNGSALRGWTHTGVTSEIGLEAQEAHIRNASKLLTTRNKRNSKLRKSVLAVRNFLRRVRGAKRP
jgi:lipopolysaccharide biosynthesis protein